MVVARGVFFNLFMGLITTADKAFMNENMKEPRTYKDLIQNRTQYLPLPGIVGMAAEFLNYGIQFPVIGRMLKYSFTIVCCAIGRLRRKAIIVGCTTY